MVRLACVRAVVLAGIVCCTVPAPAADPLPRFTEEREAAVLHFVRKHCPELLPLLDDLKRTHRSAYERQIRETFQVTELLAALQDDPKRHELELKIWTADNKALVLVARLATVKDEDRRLVEDQLQALAKDLVELDVKALEHRVGVLERELAAAKADLGRARDGAGKAARERYEAFLGQARKKRGN